MEDLKHIIGDIIYITYDGCIIGFEGDAAFNDVFIPQQQLIDYVHIGDRVIVLRFLDDLRCGNTKDSIHFRLLRAGMVIGTCKVICSSVDADIITLNLRVEMALSVQKDEEDKDITTGSNVFAADLLHKNIPLLPTVAHEMRAPLNAIIGFSDFLLHEIGVKFENEKQREYAALIKQSGEHLLDIISNYLQVKPVASLAAISNRDTDTLIYECIRLTTNLTQGRQVVFQCIEDPAPLVALSDMSFRQILINLISNAAKYSHADSCVTIRRLRGEDGYVTLVIEDNGIGMSAEELISIGSPYRRIKNAVYHDVEGSGLGLALVSELVQASGGMMNIESQKDIGTNIILTLPVADREQKNPDGKKTDILNSRIIPLTEITNVNKGKNSRKNNGKKEKETRKTA